MKKKHFSLIELLIVIVIIAILALILLPKFGLTEDSARDAVSSYNMAGFARSLEAYNTRYGAYPAGFHMCDYSKPWAMNGSAETNWPCYNWTGCPKNPVPSFEGKYKSGGVEEITGEDAVGCMKSLKLAGIKYVTTGDCEQLVLMDKADDALADSFASAMNHIPNGVIENKLLWNMTATDSGTGGIWCSNGSYLNAEERKKPYGKIKSMKYIVPMSITCSVAWSTVYKMGSNTPKASEIAAPAPWYTIDNNTVFNFPMALFVCDPNGEIPAQLLCVWKPDGTVLQTR